MSKSSLASVCNFYEEIPKPKNKKETNPNFEVHGIEIPFRMLLVGASGSMKTNTALDIFQKFNGTFDHLTVCCRNKDEPLYNLLQDKIPDDQLTMIEIEGDDLSDLPKMDGLNSSSPHTLVIFDDLCLVKKQEKICEFFIRARKCNISCMYLTQSYYASPKTIRINCNYIVLKKIDAIRDLQMILREYSLGTELDELSRMFTECTQDKLDWLMIAMQNDSDNRFFHNYTPINANGSDRPNSSSSNQNEKPVSNPDSDSDKESQAQKRKPEMDDQMKRFLLNRYSKKIKLNKST